MPQLADASKRLAQRALVICENRIELLMVEVEQERERILHAIWLALGAMVFGLLAGVALTAVIAVAFWRQSPMAALVILTVLYAAIAAVLYARLLRLQRDWQTLPTTLDQLRKDREPDVLLLDVRMPGMGGHEALAQIRKIPSLEFMPVIAITASNLLSEENLSKERFSGYVRKPFSKRELFEELADFLPRQPKAESPEEKNVPAKKEISPAPKELISQLRHLLVEPWPSIRDSVAVNESKIFAQGLEGLGQRWQCEPLVHYAQKLLLDADNYAVTDLEKHLGEFAALVEQLDQGTPE